MIPILPHLSRSVLSVHQIHRRNSLPQAEAVHRLYLVRFASASPSPVRGRIILCHLPNVGKIPHVRLIYFPLIATLPLCLSPKSTTLVHAHSTAAVLSEPLLH